MEAAERAARYVDAERGRAVVPSDAAIDRLGSLAFNATLDRPLDPLNVIAMLDEIGGAATVANTGGRYFGFVTGGVEPVGLAASVLSAAWDQNAALPVMSPVAAHLDALAAEWVVELLGLPSDSVAAFCAGATMANLTAIITGRDTLLHRIGWDTGADGLIGAPPIDVVASAEIHSSALKALRLAGLGTGAVHLVPTDDFGRARADAIPTAVLRSGNPTLLLLQAGNVNTGHSDPFAAILDRFDPATSWVHVDGAFGLWANAAPSRRHLLDGVEQADSWATDGHKWLNTPYDCGVVVVADPTALSRSMSMDAAYAGGGAGRASMNLGIQMSQGARDPRVGDPRHARSSRRRGGGRTLLRAHRTLQRCARRSWRRDPLPTRAQPGPGRLRHRRRDRRGHRPRPGERRGLDGRHRLERTTSDAHQRVRHLDHQRRRRSGDRRDPRRALTAGAPGVCRQTRPDVVAVTSELGHDGQL